MSTIGALFSTETVDENGLLAKWHNRMSVNDPIPINELQRLLKYQKPFTFTPKIELVKCESIK